MLPGSSCPSTNAALPPYPPIQTSYPPFAHFVSFPSAPSQPPHVLGCFSIPPAFSFSPDTLRVLQWNAESLRARSTERLHFISSLSVNLICIQESKPNSSYSFQIPGFSALQSDRTHTRLAFFLPIPHKLAATSSFPSGGAYSYLNFLPPLFLGLTPTLIM